MTIDSKGDLLGMRRVGRVVAETLRAMQAAVEPGITTHALDKVAELIFRRHGARSAPQLTYNFPGMTCISVNEEIVHGIPGDRKLAPGDVLKLDVTAELHGYIADAAVTVLVPPHSAEGIRLRDCVQNAFHQAASIVRPDVAISELGRAVETEARRMECSVLRELVGHGVGRTIHEEPSVPNYYSPLIRGTLTEGLVFALEPIVSAVPAQIVEEADGWTLRTHNRSLAAHYEHTIIVTSEGPEIITRQAA